MQSSTKLSSTDTKTPRTSTRTKLPRTAPATIIDPSLSHDDIAARAYELFLVEGAPHGRDVEHWLRAEHELRQGAAPSSH